MDTITKGEEGVAVVIPVHNRPTILQETLVNVMRQTLLPNKLIIVDDGSSDDTASQAEDWLKANAGSVDWMLIRNSHSGAAIARTTGFKEIGDLQYVAFLDSDDHWPTDFLERCVANLEASPDAVLAITERKYRILADEMPQSSGGAEIVANPIPWLFEHGAGITSCSLLRTSSVRKVGGWPIRLSGEGSDDSEFFCLLSLEGPWAFAEGEPVLFHIGNAVERNESVNLSRKYADRDLRWARSHEDIYQKLLKLDPSLKTTRLKKSLADRWYRAGKHCHKVRDWSEARSCFRRALYWNSQKWIYWKRFLKSGFKG